MVKLDSAGLANANLQFALLRSGSESARVELRASVVADLDAMTVVRAPVSGRLAVSVNYQWSAYGEELNTGVEVGTVSDARPLILTRGGTVTRVLARPGAIVQAGDPLLELTDFSRPVLSIVWSESAPRTPPPSITASVPGRAEFHTAELLGPAPEADPVTRQPAYLYRLTSGWSMARPGLMLSAQVPTGGGSVRGVLIPRAAAVQWDGLEWAWRKRGDAFTRIRVPTDRPAVSGWIAGSPWQAGDTLVITGGEQLLSEEFRAHVSVGDEVAE